MKAEYLVLTGAFLLTMLVIMTASNGHSGGFSDLKLVLIVVTVFSILTTASTLPIKRILARAAGFHLIKDWGKIAINTLLEAIVLVGVLIVLMYLGDLVRDLDIYFILKKIGKIVIVCLFLLAGPITMVFSDLKMFEDFQQLAMRKKIYAATLMFTVNTVFFYGIALWLIHDIRHNVFI